MFKNAAKTLLLLLMASTLSVNASTANEAAAPFIGKNTSMLKGDLMTPEALWAMGRIGSFAASPDGRTGVYNVTYYSVPQDKSHSVLYTIDMATKAVKQLTTTDASESGARFIAGGQKILFLSGQQLWVMKADGTERKQLSNLAEGVDDYLLSPDEKQIVLIHDIEDNSVIAKNPNDLSKATGMVINDLMYKHWDRFVTSIPHPFLASFSATEGIGQPKDILEGEPYECPLMPFGGAEQLAWTPDSKQIAYTCRKMTGAAYAVSTDSDIYLYDIASGKTVNLCKPAGYVRPQTDNTVSFEQQSVNQNATDCNMGYDTNPQFSPDGKYVAWLSMERDGYESDRARLCVYELATGRKQYVTEWFASDVSDFVWAADSKTLYFAGVWHGTIMVYETSLKGQHKQLTEGRWDYSVVGLTKDGNVILKGCSMSQAAELYVLNPKKKQVTQLTEENKYFYDNLTFGDVKERWVKTVDGKQELCWVIYPPHFDPAKKYPTLLFCEGGPQSPVSQFWSYRWNFQIMAANGYIIVAPNRRGLPGFGMEWLEEISGDYPGLCQQDLLSAIDDMKRESYVNSDRLGCVGASFGGYSVYWLAGHHDKRFKCFIAHDGIFNTHQQYMETEEAWFTNWDLKAAPWRTDVKQAADGYALSPHLAVDKWDAPILCIHGMKDYRVMYTQTQAAFNAARLRGIEAQMLLFPNENHWVLHPQNGVLWQRTFFNWLDKWLK